MGQGREGLRRESGLTPGAPHLARAFEVGQRNPVQAAAMRATDFGCVMPATALPGSAWRFSLSAARTP